MKTLRVVEIFETLQGEGYHAGTSAIFLRLAGCNLWSGDDEDRERDAQRHNVACPRFCDTDFRKGVRTTLEEIKNCITQLAGTRMPMLVITGGEPTLQLQDCEEMLPLPVSMIALETNGTTQIPSWIDWVCVSPKVLPDRLVVTHMDELKVVVPDYDPRVYESAILDGMLFPSHCFVSPRADPTSVGKSLLNTNNAQRAARFCIDHPMWRLSIQQHKVLGLP